MYCYSWHVIQTVNKATAHYVRQSSIFFRLPDCCLDVSMHPEVSAIGHLDKGFLSFPLSLSICWDCSQAHSCYFVHLMQPSQNYAPLLHTTPNYFSKLYNSVFKGSIFSERSKCGLSTADSKDENRNTTPPFNSSWRAERCLSTTEYREKTRNSKLVYPLISFRSKYSP
jgi:hypothetical protein